MLKSRSADSRRHIAIGAVAALCTALLLGLSAARTHAATEIGEAGPGGEMLLVTFTAASTNALGMADKRLAKAKLKP